jgi:hypothetical protein
MIVRPCELTGTIRLETGVYERIRALGLPVTDKPYVFHVIERGVAEIWYDGIFTLEIAVDQQSEESANLFGLIAVLEFLKARRLLTNEEMLLSCSSLKRPN